MIITRTPLRISFVGGGSDLPAYYRHEPGATIGAAITKYVYVALKHEYTGRVLAHYRATEDVATVDQLQHDRMRACLQRRWNFRDSVEVTSMADVPGNTGLGSSSAFTVGLLHALQPNKQQFYLAIEAVCVELGTLGAPIGKQDQYLTALGGIRFLQFHADERVEIDSVQAPDGFLSHLLLLSVGGSHDAGQILVQQSAAMDGIRRHNVTTMVELAYIFREFLEQGDFEACGKVLDSAWSLKRRLAPGITTDTIDAYYALARDAGAWGGKLCGAGGGGFLLVMAPPDRHQAIVQTTGLAPLPFGFDYEGTKVIYGTTT